MCKINYFLVLSLLGLIGESVSQIIQSGQCDDNILLQANFNFDQFIGTGPWYEYAGSDHPLSGDCSTIEFTRVDDNTVTVYHKSLRQNFLQDYHGTASVPANSARLTLNMPQISNDPIDFWVMMTDYNIFALVYNCQNLANNQRQIFVWQLSRQPTYASDTIPAFLNNTMINTLGINSNDLRAVDHSDDACYTLPVIAPGQPVILPGQCDENITVVQNFSAADFLGVWHQIYRYHSANALGSCNRAQYSSEDGIIVNVVNSQIINQNLLTIEGYATVASTDQSGKLEVVLEVAPNVTAVSDLLIIATDYRQWAISYTCENLADNQKRVFSWIVSRTRQLPPAAKAEVDAVVDSILDLNYLYYQETDQSNSACFYIPDVVEGVPAVYGGQCDLTIPVQPNFNAVDYLGIWHTIESYPTPFQSGTCINAEYSLGDVGVDVRNTQVVNESLDFVNGVAIPVGNEAKLVVSFPIAGTNLTTESDYWIISTDYRSYALVYSCTNINDYQQQITMWKLSRSKSLEPAAVTAINNALATQTVFEPRFFETIDQSREGCFYYPEPLPGVQVVFPGQCSDEDVPTVLNFNQNLFDGLWYEVEAYPKDFQPGTCVSHEFSVAGNTGFNLVSTSVADQLLGTTNSQLTFINGTDGRFTLTVQNNETDPVSFPYYVVATDYTDYALVYSCVDIDNDFKGIFSWKLSRTKTLSNPAINAINNAMADVVVLSNDYFEPIYQSDDACFYFPDLAPGEPVILPGQCDSDSVIPVITDFDAAAYLGRWRLIESYPSNNQRGACNQARYSLTDDGTLTVIVRNSQVVNQTFVQAVGSAVPAASVGNETLGKLIVTFPNSQVPFELWILGTDYENYALVYGCVNINNQQRQIWSWKLSRTRNLSPQSTQAINAITSGVTVLNDRYYETIDHSDAACFYFPEPDTSRSVIFPGQCDESIPVVTNFDAVAYMELWHNIERYPSPFQSGTCSNAFYRLLDGPVVEVFNTQVVNQTLGTIRGTAVLDRVDANDTSAKLLVTFPIQGQNRISPYWVLSTDYTTYALVYSCVNIDDEYRSVTSWKLSRTKSLAPAAINSINAVVSTIDVLDDRYYEEQDQSPEGCFYFPEPEPGVPVVFPGQCDVNATVVQNFNLTAFHGIWYEIEAYPKVEQGGQCISHEFSPNTATTMNFASSNVIDQSLGITRGTVRPAFNDDTGRFFLEFYSDGILITIPYWIVSTDYENYALAYSCVNQNSDFRGVFSWKLSRTKQLSNDAINAINNAMTDVAVLSNDYFEPIDQSDDACFYFPDLAPGEPVILPGQCDSDSVIPVITDFDAAAYLGRWRLIESYPSNNQRGACNQARYSLSDDGTSTVIVRNSQVVNQTFLQAVGSAVPAASVGNETLGKLIVTFPNSQEPFELWILGTDYENYALVYGCVNINNQQRQIWSWKMSRTRNLSPQSIQAINAITGGVTVLNDRYYETIDHSDAACFYFPEPDTSRSVIFPGQCDESIPVVNNFDAVAYMELWHDIERYPAPFQFGTCSNAFYRLLDGPVVDVFNTQVVNQTLDTISGTAVLDRVDANDTSAKLLVTFPIQGQNRISPYWVLSTDYTTYALVYSCVNIDDEYRSVTSWKLSRTKSLAPAAINSINAVVSTIDVLDERYYVEQDQSPEGCFYFPEPEPGVPVVFPGQCDVNATVVQNFNLTAFQGLWYEIEAYPKEEQTGQCISHEFTLNAANILTFESLNVIAESLGITTGTVRVTSNDNSARLELVFVSNGITITIPYWILDTDYENYAVAYSCVNQPNIDFRGVWSWKLSRTKQLSANSVTAINNALEEIDVLDNVYYEPISQSDESCFYYPDLSPGEPVIFPGQCDTNINVVQNFNTTGYLGLWRLIETYPSEFQTGDCNDATYSLSDDGSVIVYNTVVFNETLRTIEGSAVLASNDGSGKLLVTFPSSPEPAEYWILDTDYDTYSIVYSCVNINEKQRRVYSWKLSRTDVLPQAAVAAIEQTISNINVLDSRYYEIVDRTPESCFYYPEPNGKPVIFRGQCDENIGVVMGFDATRYTGTWYNMESYPSRFQDGTCSVANYELDPDTLVVYVENTQVLNQVLDVQTGTAVLASNDTSAKLLVTFEVNGVTVTQNYWVIVTDYISYSLVYSCQNIDNEHRQVNSWKLGRTRDRFSTGAYANMDIAMQNIQVLDQMYFEDGRQSEQDCFFYPDNNGGDVILNGECVPDNQVAAVTNFNANAFTGTWHEVARFPSDLQVGECAAAEYALGDQNSVIITQTEVDNELISANIIPGSIPEGGRGVINAEIPGIPFNTFYILDTDYVEFALIYGCRNTNNGTKQIYSWKMSRSREGLSPQANARINEVVSTNVDLFENYFEYTDQSVDACFHYPEYDELPPTIELLGPCDESIRAVPNFSTNFLGHWIEIEKYPQLDQFGTCDRAFYDATEDGRVAIWNSQVVNRTRLDQRGVASLAEDGTGLLDVTFVVNGITMTANYYVLATDYSNYALVYSCRNLDNGYRQVSSWKLSRTTELSAEANRVMNEVISQTQGLNQDYYKRTDQSAEACFYVPELDVNRPPSFRGQCEDDPPIGVVNFDAARYAGWWHEIKSYPTGLGGDCVSSRYDGTGNTYQVVDLRVFNGSASTQSGTVQVSSDGRLRRTINGVTEDIWVLATDYENYSLLYKCSNTPDNYRQIWSAKHSKTRELTVEAEAAMAPVIESNDLLYPQFYLDVDQSDEACFHYPEPTGQQVILPGQCDDNIPVVTNFDVEAYEGTWYQIQRYPQVYEDPTSTCIGARYTLDSDSGVVNVLNWEVIDGTLVTIEGNATLSSTDGSAKLTVVLPVVNSPTNATVTTSLYVLKTNYVDYALAYSCRNINPFQRSVGAWKLSRERTLLPESNTAINNYMASRPELEQSYFITVQHDEECEEPSSGTLLRSSIIVMIICALWQILS